MNKDILREIINQEMDRKAFLKYSGFALLGLVGLKSVISLLMQKDNRKMPDTTTDKILARGFGKGKYGA